MDKTFYDVKQKDEIISFLNTKIKDSLADPDKKWITTWNDYLWTIKYFFRWLHNYKLAAEKATELTNTDDWFTPSFVSIKKKKTNRISPYLENELWEKEEEEAAQNWVVVSPKIVYEGNEVNSMLIWLDFIDRNGVIYIAPFIGVDRKQSNIRLSYTIGKDINAISNGSKMEGDLVEEWTIGTMQKIVVKHNKLNTGVTIQKVFGIEGLADDKVQRTIYIPMSRIYHIKTGELTIYKDEIEK